MKYPSELNKSGFTLVELMVAMVISMVLAVVIFTVYESQVRAQLTQELYTELQESMRSALIIMEQEIRTAAADPTGLTDKKDVRAEIILAEADKLWFTRDITGDNIDGRPVYDGHIKGISGSSAFSAGTTQDPEEDVFYEFDVTEGRLTRRIGGVGADPAVLLDHVEALEFVYLDNNGNVTADTAEIARIELTIVARSDREVGGWFMKRRQDIRSYENMQGDVIFSPAGEEQFYRRLRMSTGITCRNMLGEQL